MLSETPKPTSQSSSEGDKHKSFDREVKDMVNALTSRFSGPHKAGAAGEDEDGGVRIITLAGNNTGATMRSELQDGTSKNVPQGVSIGEPEGLGTYVNSNFQAVNNSIMLSSSYNTNDPGVHLEISDLSEMPGKKTDKVSRKGKKREKDVFQSDQISGRSD